jgi:hypothetical protein
MSPRETTPISFSSLQTGSRMMWKSSIILIILVAGVSGFSVATSGVMLSPAVTRVSSGLSLKAQNIKFSDDAYDGAIVFSDRHSTLLLGYKLKRDISVGGVFLAEIAGCVIISAAVLSSMIDHILSYSTSNGMCRAPENYLLTY